MQSVDSMCVCVGRSVSEYSTISFTNLPGEILLPHVYINVSRIRAFYKYA